MLPAISVGRADGWAKCCSRLHDRARIARAAAQALLAFATSRTAAVAGSYATVNPSADIWPGDVLAVTSDGVTSSLLVRSVEVKDGNAVPEIRTYAIKFANDWATQWADGLGLKLSEAIAADAFLPATAEGAPAQVLANLQQLSVTSVNGSEVADRCGMRSADWWRVRGSAARLELRSGRRHGRSGSAQSGAELFFSASGAGGAVLRADV